MKKAWAGFSKHGKGIGYGLLGFAALIVLGTLLHAQTATVSPPPDSIVQVTAEAQGLEPVASADLPSGGTFWLVTSNGITAPSPCPPSNLSDFPVYAMADGIYLVDETSGQVVTNEENSTIESALAAQADAVTGLINQIQDAQFNQDLAMAFGLDMEMDSSSSFSPMFAVSDPTALWLEITNVANDWSYLNLHNGTNFVYAILSKTNLTDATWNIERELFPTLDQTNVMPFAVQNFDRQILFLKAMDWTGVTENGNTTPDWWLWMYYGTTALSDTNLDSRGNNTLLTDFQAGTDPNIISFTLEAGNQYVNIPFANLQLNITAGTPSYYAVLVNGQITTNWLPFVSTNLTASLSSTDGVYDVSVGLRGLPADATQTWQDYSFTLDTVPPEVTITNPIAGSDAVIKPYLQLQGFANEPLASLSYDINNAFGLATNQNAFVTDQTFDTNQVDFTTNYFHAYDVPLATNDNCITLRLTDRAGNTTTTNFDVVLDYTGATNPPVINLLWPQDGMAVSGTNITIRGTMSDETGGIVAQIVDGDGNTNTVQGIVERNNMFWIENVPVNGTSQISLQATDAAGNVTTNNFTVTPSDLILTIDSTPTGDALYQGYGSVSGTISDSSYAVVVNGMAVTNDYWTDGETWYWEVDNVPIYGQGTATFDAVATPGQSSFSSQRLQAMSHTMNSSSSSSTPANASATVEMGPYVAIVSYHSVEEQDYSDAYYSSTSRVQKDQTAQAVVTNGQWTMSGQATNDSRWADTYDGSSESVYTWSVGSPYVVTEHYTNSYGYTYDSPVGWGDDSGVYQMEVTAIPHEDQDWGCASCGYSYEWAAVRHYYADGPPYHWDLGWGGAFDLSLSAKTAVKLYTGGKALVGRQNLFQINAWANEIQRPPLDYGTDYPWWDVREVAITPAKLQVAGKTPGEDGNVWLALADNSEQFITVHAPGKRHYDAWATPTKYPAYIGLTTSTTNANLDTDMPEVCVGQNVTFTLNGMPMDQIVNMVGQWSLPTKYVNESWQETQSIVDPGTGLGTAVPYGSVNYDISTSLLQNTNKTSGWFVNTNDGHASVSLNLKFQNGQYASVAANGDFTVFRPTAEITRIDEPRYYTLSNTNLPATTLKLGNASGDGSMYYQVKAHTKSPFYGNVNMTQLIRADYSDPVYDFSVERCDGSEFYNDPSARVTSAGGVTGIADGPGETWLTPNIVNLSARDFVRFQPDGDGSIYVTLGIVTWDTVGTAEQSFLGNWSITTDTTPDPSGPDSSDEFPVWTQSITAH
jgi:hypothetical protein